MELDAAMERVYELSDLLEGDPCKGAEHAGSAREEIYSLLHPLDSRFQSDPEQRRLDDARKLLKGWLTASKYAEAAAVHAYRHEEAEIGKEQVRLSRLHAQRACFVQQKLLYPEDKRVRGTIHLRQGRAHLRRARTEVYHQVSRYAPIAFITKRMGPADLGGLIEESEPVPWGPIETREVYENCDHAHSNFQSARMNTHLQAVVNENLNELNRIEIAAQHYS